MQAWPTHPSTVVFSTAVFSAVVFSAAVFLAATSLFAPSPAEAGGLEPKPKIEVVAAMYACKREARADWQRDALGNYTLRLKDGGYVSSVIQVEAARSESECLNRLIKRLFREMFDPELENLDELDELLDGIEQRYGKLYYLVTAAHKNRRAASDTSGSGVSANLEFQRDLLDRMASEFNRW